MVLLTSSNGEQDFRRHRGWLTASATTEREVAEALRLLHVELGRRKVILAHWGASFWMNLSAETRRFEKLFPIAVLVDDYVMHFRQAATPRWAETILPAEFSRLQALNKAKAASQVIIEQLAREGGRFGIHLVASVNTPDLNALPGGLQRNLTARVLVINPHAFSVPSNIRQLFPNAGQEASCMLKEAARELVRSKGHALVLGAQKQLSLARIDLVRSNEVSEYLKAIGVPRPDTWHLDR